LANTNQFGIHHDTRCAAIAIDKGMYLGNQKHPKHSPLEVRAEAAKQGKTLIDGALHKVRGNEHSCTGGIVPYLEGARRLV
jgi:hypothetical protein